MKTFSVIIPIAGHVVVDVDATSAEEAKEVAFSIAADALGRMIKDDEEQKARIENLELLEEFNKGNVCYCPSPHEIEVDEI